MRFLVIFVIVAAVLGTGAWFWASQSLKPETAGLSPVPEKTFWNFQSIDTMKYSRDLAREKRDDASFTAVIENQIKMIAATGATHIAVATPYDEEFVPFLRRWVEAARRQGLKVWFRGNFSGWERWFGYPAINRAEHRQKTETFILTHPDLFQDGDAFSSCPECENGGPGDPRQTGDVLGHRQFLVAEYQTTQEAFQKIGKNVQSNLFSMNGDVARLVMDKETTRMLGGIVTIDHYVKAPEQLAQDVAAIAEKSGGRVVLGEFGAPIPDIHGPLSEAEQEQWIAQVMTLMARSPNVAGVNYWLSVGGSTELWNEQGRPRQAVGILTDYFKPQGLSGFVRNELGQPIPEARVSLEGIMASTDRHGHYLLLSRASLDPEVTIEAAGFILQKQRISPAASELSVTLIKEQKDWTFRILEYLKQKRLF